jgi:Golgi phosphoprotein 3 (GPP34)
VATLAEELYLLADDSTTGRPLIDRAHLDLGLGGALLLDLALRDRVAEVDAHVVVSDPTPTGDPLLDGALATLSAATRAHDPEHWVRHLARGARHAVQDRLLTAGVLRRDDHKVLGLIPVHRTHEADGRLHHKLVDHLHDAVVLGHRPSRETAALASLALAVGLERHLFPRSDRRAVAQRLAEIAEGRWVGSAVRHTIDAVNATLGITPSPGSLP